MVAMPLAFILPGIPEIWYELDASAVNKEVEQLVQDLGQQQQDFIDTKTNVPLVAVNRPSIDPTLPTDNRVRIPSIGVDGKIYEGTNAEKTLARGIWRTNNWGTPEESIPTILASHRYGNPRWSKDFRDREIFYNLDKVNVGDTVEVVWGQRLYRYKIYATDVFTRIRDEYTDADLIIYTCNYWNSPKRIFAFAKRI